MARERTLATLPRAPQARPRLRKPESRDTTTGSQAPASPFSPKPLSPQFVSSILNFTAATFNDCLGWPPDTMGAAGPSQFIIALNGRVRSFDKTTGAADGAINEDTDTFFSSVMTPGSNVSSDPHIRYDRLSGRWFVTMIDVPGRQATQPNRIMIAMSDSGTISGGTVWSFFQFEQDLVGTTPNSDTGDFADFPTLGIDANALYIGVNLFTSSGSFANTTAFVVQKSSLIGSGPIQVTAFRGLISGTTGPFTPQGVDNYDAAATEGYFIGVDNSGSSQLDLLRVSNPGSLSPSLSASMPITVTAWHAPINVAAFGTSGTVDGGDARLLAAHYRNGSLWTSHNVGVNNTGGTRRPNRDGVRWYQITGIPSGQTPSIVQSGTMYQPGSAGSQSYWMGTIMVSGQGHAAMGFSAAGPTNAINAATVGRLAGDAAGTMETPVLYTSSSIAYNPSDNVSPHRWGDFSYTSLDPSDDMTMWTIQEWCQSPGNGYAVQAAQLLAPPPATPTSCVPSTLTQGVASVTVTISGSTAGAAGFFDPGPGFSNHLAVVVNGNGVNATSVTYNNPSNLTAVLTVAANAAPGARTISVVNPDGQSATSGSALLTIIGSGPNAAPTLAPISDQTVAVGITLVLTNVASDSDGDLLTFSFGAGAAANASINATSGIFRWSPTQAQIGTNTFSVIVTDSGLPSLSATQSFNVTVVQSNSPPVLAAIANQKIAVGMTLVISNTASDADGDQLTFSLGAGAAANASINGASGVFNWSPTQAQIGSNAFSVIVTDNGVPPLSATQHFTVTVIQSNSPPTLAPITNQTIAVGMTLVLTNVANDPDGDKLTFSLEAGAVTNATINATNGVFSWSPTGADVGTNSFTVMVTDNGPPPLSATQSFNVIVVQSNHPPVLAAIANQIIYELTTLVLTNSATDPDTGQVLTFSLDAGAPTGATIGATNGVFTWTAAASQAGTNSITVRVTDNGLPNLSDAKTFSVTVEPWPTLALVNVSTNGATLNWNAISGTTYRVQFKTNLADSAWSNLSADVFATGATASAFDFKPNTTIFYRITVVP